MNIDVHVHTRYYSSCSIIDPKDILDKGEAEVMAVAKMLEEKKNEVAMIIDERTARVLCEKPENLQKLLKRN